VEYAVILPTLWAFLQSLGMHHRWYFGLVLASFSAASMVAAPLYGHFADKGGVKRLLYVATIFMVVGNFFYMIANDAYVVLEARFLCGWGAGVASATFAYLARVTTVAERTKVIGSIMAARQLGILIGPAFNFGLTHCNFKLGPFEITNLTSPGFVMMIFWAATLVVTYAYFTDIDAPMPLARTSFNRRRTLSQGKNLLFLEGGSPEGANGDHGRARPSYGTSLNTSENAASDNSNGGGGGGNGVSRHANAHTKNINGASDDHDGDSNDADGEDQPLIRAPLNNARLAAGRPLVSSAAVDRQNGGGARGQRQVLFPGATGGGAGGQLKVPPLLGVGAAGVAPRESAAATGSGDRTASSSSSNGAPVTAGYGRNDASDDDAPPPPLSLWQEYTQLPILALFLVSFLCIFNQLGLETWVTPFTQEYFGWAERENR
jgi:ceroid-lipofuscinosis MFS transporter 7